MKSLKVIGIISGVIIAGGILAGCSGMKKNENVDFALNCNNDIKKLDINLKFADLNIEEGDEFKVKGNNILKEDYSVDVKDGTLQVKTIEKEELVIGDASDDSITVVIPKDYIFENIDITSAIRTVKSDAKIISKKGRFDLSCDINMSYFDIDQCEIKCSAGDIYINENKKGGNSIVAGYGNIELNIPGDESEYNLDINGWGGSFVNGKDHFNNVKNNNSNIIKIEAPLGKAIVNTNKQEL